MDQNFIVKTKQIYLKNTKIIYKVISKYKQIIFVLIANSKKMMKI